MPRPNRPPPVQQVPLVRCVRCQITLRLPLNAPVFQCPQCSQRLRAPPAVVEVANREKAMQALVTAGAALRDGASWACEICTHVNTLSVEACIMCSTSRQDARKVLMAQEAGGDEADGEIAVADFADGALEQGHIEVKTSAAREQAGRLQRMGEASRRRGASDATGPAALRQTLATCWEAVVPRRATICAALPALESLLVELELGATRPKSAGAARPSKGLAALFGRRASI